MLGEATLLPKFKVELKQKKVVSETSKSSSTIMGWDLDKKNTGLRGNYSGLKKLDLNGADSGVGRMNGNTLFVNAGKTIENRIIPCPLNLEAGGITIRKCLIQPLEVGRGMPYIKCENSTLEDSEIDGSKMPGNVMGMSIAFAGSGKILRCDIHHASTGISINNASNTVSVAESNYIHDLVYVEPAHIDGITTRISSGAGTTIRNNRIVINSKIATGGIFIQTTFGRIDNLTIEGNLIEGYGYNLAMDKSRFDYGKNIKIKNNRFKPYQGGLGVVSIQAGINIADGSGNCLYEASSKDGKGKAVSVGK